MDGPRFRPLFFFGFLPLNLHALAAMAAFLVVEVPLMAVSFYVESESVGWWCIAALAFALFMGFWGFVLFRSE